MASRKSLAKSAAKYLGSKSLREISRLAGKRGIPQKPRRGRMLRASNRWREWEIELLGKISDKEAARRTGRKITSVGEKRRALGRNYYKLPNATHGRAWTKRELAPLGTAMDSVIAKKLNRTTEAIKCQRKKKGVPAFRPLHLWTKAEDKIVMGCSYKEAAQRLNLPQHAVESRRRSLLTGNVGGPARKWTAEEIALLGKYTDTQLAKKLKRSRSTVAWKRRALHIHANGDYSRRWRLEEERLLGTLPDAQLAPVLKRGIKSVQARRLKLGIWSKRVKWEPEERKLLKRLAGRYSDREVARRLNKPEKSVTYQRRLLGIPSFRKVGYYWTPEETRLVGTMPDREVARQLGRSVSSVAEKRRSLGTFPLLRPARLKWTTEEQRLLGTMPDVEVAKRFNRSASGVSHRRRRLGISVRFPNVSAMRVPTSQMREVLSYIGRRKSRAR